MSGVPKRAWVEMAVAGALAVAACTALSQTAERKADEARRMLESGRWELEQNRTRLVPEAMEAIRNLATKRRSIMLSASKLQEDESRLYARLSEIATQCAVQIDQIVPAAATAQPVTVPARDASAGTPAIGAQSTYTLTVAGTFAHVAEFVHDLESSAGFTAVRSLRMSPVDATPSSPVRAVLITDHFGIFASQLGGEEQP